MSLMDVFAMVVGYAVVCFSGLLVTLILLKTAYEYKVSELFEDMTIRDIRQAVAEWRRNHPEKVKSNE